jgi:hypothetical protein
LLGKYVRNMTIRHNFKCTSSQSIFITWASEDCSVRPKHVRRFYSLSI